MSSSMPNTGGLFASCGKFHPSECCAPSSTNQMNQLSSQHLKYSQLQSQQGHYRQGGSVQQGACCDGSDCLDSISGGTNTNDRLTVRLQADQPVIPVPLYQDVLRRDKYVEIPKVELHDTYVPLLYNQDAIHDIPKMDVSYREKPIELAAHRYVDKPVEVPVYLGYKPSFVPKWDVRQVPRPIPKYYGEQQIIEIGVPQIKYVDKPVEKEVVIDVQEKIVPKIVEVEKEVEVVQYEWKKQHQDIPIYKYVPKFDIELECPPPLIVPYPETTYIKEPPVFSTANWNCQQPEQGQITQHSALPYSFQSLTKDAIQGQENLRGAAYPAVTPVPSPQIVKCHPSQETHKESTRQIEIEKEILKKKNWWFWPFSNENSFSSCCRENTKEADYSNDYSSSISNNFLRFFHKGVKDVEQQKDKIYEEVRNQAQEEGIAAACDIMKQSPPPGCDLEPTIEYKGAVNKPPEYAGKLEPISFKLHAIEVHQFIPLPNIETPQFIKMMPSADHSANAEKEQLEKLFGPVASGWADPTITGMPAPMMNDIIRGNLHPNSPLFQQISIGGSLDEEEEKGKQEAHSEECVIKTISPDGDVINQAE